MGVSPSRSLSINLCDSESVGMFQLMLIVLHSFIYFFLKRGSDHCGNAMGDSFFFFLLEENKCVLI